MKKIILFMLFVCNILFAFSQNDVSYKRSDTIFYSSSEKITNKEEAKKLAVVKGYLRYKGKILYKADMFKLDEEDEFYYKTETFYTHYFESIGRERKQITYWKNGNKSAEGLIKKSRRIGTWLTWYEDGTKMSERKYFEQKKLLGGKSIPSQLINFWNKKGEQTVKDGTGEYFYETEKGAEHKGKIINYKKEGVWIGFRKDGSRIYKETYKNGKLKKGESWDREGKKYKYKEVFVNTKYSGGSKGLAQMIMKNFRTPQYAIDNKIEGLMLVTFKVNKNGEVQDIEVRKKLCGPCDQEAIRIVSLLKKWRPAKSRGQKVNVKYTLPLRITQ
ncbi:energy transducer TonB [Pseudotenacibaculum sp. MALMAid0570]|uniref:energy transducer TonB n=1 Tax=Pseudotenacibaculum sp. MALMAid0570 TaxID=3143938 RepID=UPI0032E00D3B